MRLPSSPPGRSKAWLLLKNTAVEWRKNNTSLLAAGLAYFTIFSLPPLIILIIAVSGFFLGEMAVSGEIFNEFQGYLGKEVAGALQGIIENAIKSGIGFATVLGSVILFLGASGVFAQLQRVLNMIWNVQARRGVKRFILNRIWAFIMALGVGMILLAAFSLNAGLRVLHGYLGNSLPSLEHIGLWRWANFGVSLGTVAVLSAAVYKFIPETKIGWKDVWVGGSLTSFLLAAGSYILGSYFNLNRFKSVYGVAASAAVVLVWVYYSALIFLLGAQFTWVYSHVFGSRSRPEYNPP